MRGKAKKLVAAHKEADTDLGLMARMIEQLAMMVEWADKGGGYIPSCPVCGARIQDNEAHDKYCTWAEQVAKARGEMR